MSLLPKNMWYTLPALRSYQFLASVQFSHSVVSDFLQPHGLQHTKLPCPSSATAKSLQSCPTLCNPIEGSPPGSPSLGFSRQEHWSGLPFPSPMQESKKWKWSRSVVPNPQQPHRLQPSRLLRPWDFPGKNTGVGCHCLEKPRQHFKKQRHYFTSKCPSSQGCGFSSNYVWMWELDYKESWVLKNWCFWMVVLEKTLESPRESQPVHPKGDQSWIFIGRTCWSWSSNTLAT